MIRSCVLNVLVDVSSLAEDTGFTHVRSVTSDEALLFEVSPDRFYLLSERCFEVCDIRISDVVYMQPIHKSYCVLVSVPYEGMKPEHLDVI